MDNAATRSSLPSHFLPLSSQTSQHKIEQQAGWFERNTTLTQALDGIPNPVLILNQERQIVFANQAMLDLLHSADRNLILGQMVGDALDCHHADQGCGTTEFCRTCGGFRAVSASLENRPAAQECHILQQNGDALDLQVSARPVWFEGQPFTLFSIQDISHEKRRRVLEHLFFHDILNTAGLIKGYADIADKVNADEMDSILQHLGPIATRLIHEIESQRLLLEAENNELAVSWHETRTLTLLAELQAEFAHHPAVARRQLTITDQAADFSVVTDVTLLGRVLSNLIKNALEASEPGQSVTLDCWQDNDAVVFSVHNIGVMPRNTQLQIFKRSFSTKGQGRGIGTYSAKLLTERYLQGQIWFTSSPEDGTRFLVRYPRAAVQ
jgi:nitrogen-specific signal transduction histidine kinase